MIRKSVMLFLLGFSSLIPFSALIAAVFWWFNHRVGIVVFAIFFCINTGIYLERYSQKEVAIHSGMDNNSGFREPYKF